MEEGEKERIDGDSESRLSTNDKNNNVVVLMNISRYRKCCIQNICASILV
jgi:hypothetical protein